MVALANRWSTDAAPEPLIIPARATARVGAAFGSLLIAVLLRPQGLAL